MKRKAVVVMCALLLAVPVFSFAKEKAEPRPSMSAYEHANENAKFKRTRNLFNNKANKEKRAKRLAEKEAKKVAKAKRKKEESENKGEGQFKFKF